MKVALLTTDTPHHAYYAWKLGARVPLTAIALERWRPSPPFETGHPFEEQRDEYERVTLLAGGPTSCHDLARVYDCERVNDASAVERLAALRPDIVLIFGTGLVTPAVIQTARVACLNLHGGNPEEYRGLDTHLWAIYHRDFDNLVTTLHHVDAGLDTGDIVSQAPLEVPAGTELFQLRAINTRVCVDLSLQALEGLGRGSLPARQQTRRGRYYSHMPSCLKQECVIRFRRHTAVPATL